jgi:DNA gyrase/topoisomerase IV subunit A
VNKRATSSSIADLVRDKTVEGISDLRDESDRERHAHRDRAEEGRDPQVVLNQLYKHTSMQTTFGVIMLALVDNGGPARAEPARADAPALHRSTATRSSSAAPAST